MNLSKSIFIFVAALLTACESGAEAEYCALRKEITQITAEAISGAANGSIPLQRSADIMKKVTEEMLPRLEKLEKKLPSNFNYKERCGVK
jgi:hypothetical protein